MHTFKVGDRIRYKEKGAKYHKHGTIYHVDPHHQVYILFDADPEAWIIKKVSFSDVSSLCECEEYKPIFEEKCGKYCDYCEIQLVDMPHITLKRGSFTYYFCNSDCEANYEKEFKKSAGEGSL